MLQLVGFRRKAKDVFVPVTSSPTELGLNRSHASCLCLSFPHPSSRPAGSTSHLFSRPCCNRTIFSRHQSCTSLLQIQDHHKTLSTLFSPSLFKHNCTLFVEQCKFLSVISFLQRQRREVCLSVGKPSLAKEGRNLTFGGYLHLAIERGSPCFCARVQPQSTGALEGLFVG